MREPWPPARRPSGGPQRSPCPALSPYWPRALRRCVGAWMLEISKEIGYLVVHPASRMRLLRVWSVSRGAGPDWGGCDDPSGARVERRGGAQASAVSDQVDT